MTAGRPAKPTALKVLQGNPGHRPLTPNEPQPDPVADLKPPRWLDARGRKVWRELAPVALGMGVLTEADAELFGHACACLAEARQQQGRASKELEMANKILARFGFTPSDRTKISVTPKKDDPFDDFLKRKA